MFASQMACQEMHCSLSSVFSTGSGFETISRRKFPYDSRDSEGKKNRQACCTSDQSRVGTVEKPSREKPHNHRKSSHTVRASSQHLFFILKTYAALLRWRDVCSPRWTNSFSNGQLASTIGFIARQDCVAKDLMGKRRAIMSRSAF